MITCTSLTIRLHWVQAVSRGSGITGRGEPGFTSSSCSVFAGWEELGFPGITGSAFAGTKMERVDWTLLVTVNLALHEVVDLALHLAVHLTSLKVGRGVLYTADGGMM